ncbi:hypothetical protein Tco_1388739 [Tanacetum coccineum]
MLSTAASSTYSPGQSLLDVAIPDFVGNCTLTAGELSSYCDSSWITPSYQFLDMFRQLPKTMIVHDVDSTASIHVNPAYFVQQLLP